MAQPWCTGAAHIFLGVGGSKTSKSPLYLGTCESKPGLEGQVKFDPIMNDLSGSQVPFDYSFQGELGLLSLTLTRYNETVYQAATNLPNPFGGVRGTIDALDVGTIMGLEGMAIPVWVQFPYAAKVAMATSEAGRRYQQAILFDRYGIESGTRYKKINLIFLAWPAYDKTTGKFVLYDQNMTGLPAKD